MSRVYKSLGTRSLPSDRLYMTTSATSRTQRNIVISVSDSDGRRSTKDASNATEPLNQSEAAVLKTAPAV
jgi:hypothetical protein